MLKLNSTKCDYKKRYSRRRMLMTTPSSEFILISLTLSYRLYKPDLEILNSKVYDFYQKFKEENDKRTNGFISVEEYIRN